MSNLKLQSALLSFLLLFPLGGAAGPVGSLTPFSGIGPLTDFFVDLRSPAVISHDGRFVFMVSRGEVAGFDSAVVSIEIGKNSSRVISRMPQGTTRLEQLALSPDGSVLAAAGGSGTVVFFTVDPISGALTEAGSFSQGGLISADHRIVFHPSGQVLYYGNSDAPGRLRVLDANPAGGISTTPLQDITLGTSLEAFQIAVSEFGTAVVVSALKRSGLNDDSLIVFVADGSGLLSDTAFPPGRLRYEPGVDLGWDVFHNAVVTPDAARAYVLDVGGSSIHEIDLTQSGVVTVPTDTIPVSVQPRSLTLSEQGNVLSCVCQDQVDNFAIDPDGLEPIRLLSSFDPPNSAVFDGSNNVILDPNGARGVVASMSNGRVFTFTTSTPDSGLVNTTPLGVYPTPGPPTAIAGGYENRRIMALVPELNQAGVFSRTVLDVGLVTNTVFQNGGSFPFSVDNRIATSPDGRLIHATSDGFNAGSGTTVTIDISGEAVQTTPLIQRQPEAGRAIVTSDDGSTVAVVSQTQVHVYRSALGVTPDGVFTPSGADLTNALPVMSEDGTDLYVGDGGNDQLHVLDLTAAGPTLTPIQSIDFGAAVGEPRLALSEDESMLAALPGGTNTVLFYDRQAGGQLQTPPRTVTLPTFVTLYDGVVFMPNASRAILRAGTDVHLVSTGVGGTVLDSLTLQSPTGSVSAVPGRWRAAIMEPSLTRMTVVQALANDTLEVVGAHDFSVLTSFELSAIPAITPDGQIGILPSSSAAPLGGGFLVDLEQTGINSLALIGGQRGATNAVAVDKQGVVLASLDTDSNSLVAQLIARSDPPRIATATLVETTGAFPDGTGGPGDIIQLTFDRPLRPGGGLVGAGDFFLQGGGSLGSSAFVFPVDISLENFATNRAQILLGIGATVNTTAPSVAIDIGPSPTNSLLRSFADGRVAQDLGVVGALDSGVPITQPMFETGSDFSELGGFVQLPGLQGALFTLSSFAMQPGILSETIYIFIGPPPFAFPQAGFLNAVQLRAEAPLPDFDPPATLTVQYDPTGLSSESGESEKFLRIVQLVDMGGEIVPFPLEGTMFIDTVNKTISTEITSLDPTGMAAASESHPRGPSGPVGVFATLPVNPVEERSIFIAPGGAAGASAQSPGAISLSSGDGSVYPNHLISFPGFVQTSGSDPNRIQISVRSSTLFDRVSLGGGTSFPEQSGAIFTVETKNASGQPVAFTSPVDITVQFIERPAANETDAVDFNSIAGDPNQMRMVQDVLAGIGADFEFIGGSVNGSVVTRSGHTPLTDASGAGTFGAVIDPNAVASLSLQDIVNHILGVSVLSQQSAYFLQADLAEPFQVLDAADLVLFVLAHQDEGQPEPRNP